MTTKKDEICRFVVTYVDVGNCDIASWTTSPVTIRQAIDGINCIPDDTVEIRIRRIPVRIRRVPEHSK